MPLKAVDSVNPTGQKSDRRLRIGVFGSLSCETCDGDALLPRRRKSRGLLAYLALARGRPVPRSRIAGLLWDANAEDQARTSLRQALVDVTASLLPAGFATIEARRDDLVLRPDAYVLDLSVFDEKPPAESGAGDGSPGLRLPTAALLEDLDGLSESFDHFLAEERVRADHLRLRWHEARLKALDPQSDPEARLRVARALLAVDLAHEQAWRVAIRAQADLGDVGQALQQFRECEAALARLLDASPSAETKALIAQIQKTGGAAASRIGSSTPSRVYPAVSSAREATASAFDAPSVAVLPFRWLGPEKEEVWLCEGVTDDIVCVLAGIREPIVISSNSSRQFKDQTEPRGVIAERLGADYLVTGSIRMADDRVRIAVALEEAKGGATLWAESYGATKSGLFDAQTEIAARIAHALTPRVQAAELRHSMRKPPEDLSAYHLMLRARELMFRLDRVSFDQAGQLLNRALEIDQGYANLHFMLAFWHSMRIFEDWTHDWKEDQRLMDRAANAALRLDPDHARTLAMLGHSAATANRRFDEARELFDRALSIAPNDVDALSWSVPTLAYAGEHQEAIDRSKKVMNLSPLDPFRFRHQHFLSIAYFSAGDLEQSARWGLTATSHNPNYKSNLRLTIACLTGLGRTDEADRLKDQLRRIHPTLVAKRRGDGPPFQQIEKRRQFESLLEAAGLIAPDA